MRLLMLLLFAVSICACTSQPPTTTPTVTEPSPIASAPLFMPSAAPPVAPNLPIDLSPFDAALRPEFRGDLALLHSPTVYRMNLQLDPSLAKMSGEESVTYTNRTQQALNEVYFRLFANYPSPQGSDKEFVKGVRVNGAVVTPTLESQDTALRVPLKPSLAPNGSLNLDLNFDATIPLSSTTHYADFTNSEGIISLPSIYPLIPAHDEKGWHTELPPPYGDFVYDDTSLYDIRFTAPIHLDRDRIRLHGRDEHARGAKNVAYGRRANARF